MRHSSFFFGHTWERSSQPTQLCRANRSCKEWSFESRQQDHDVLRQLAGPKKIDRKSKRPAATRKFLLWRESVSRGCCVGGSYLGKRRGTRLFLGLRDFRKKIQDSRHSKSTQRSNSSRKRILSTRSVIKQSLPRLMSRDERLRRHPV